MPKTKISEYSVTNSSNTDIEGINIDEGCAPSGINNAIRELMVHLKEFQTGASGDAFTFAGGVLISGTANTITGNVLMSGTNTITGSTTATFAAGAVGTPSIAAHGDTNTGIFFPAADTISATTGGTERIRLDASGRLGIGKTPSHRLDVGASSGTVAVFTQSSATGYGMTIIPGADTSYDAFTINNAANTLNQIQMYGNGTARFAGSVSVGGATPTTSGAGITFPATQSASSNANTLDDYEEGNWTPVVTGLTSAGTATYSAQTGRYTKIGNRVFITCDVSWSGHTGTGNMVVTGLPFALNNTDGYVPFSPGETNNIAWTANYSFTPTGGVNSTQVFINQSYVGGSGGSLNTSVDASGGISFSGNYAV